MSPSAYDPQVDAYLVKAKPFAQPILTHLRDLVHRACPEATESIKWSRPFFDHRGKILAGMAAFTAHCSFGFWGAEIAAHLAGTGLRESGGITSLDKLKILGDLPSDAALLAWIAQAAHFIDTGHYTGLITARTAKPVPEPPAAFTTALAGAPEAAFHFDALSPSCKRQYIEWIVQAKHAETRDKRIASSIAMIAAGKRNPYPHA